MNFQHSSFLEHEKRSQLSKPISLHEAYLPLIVHISTQQKHPDITCLNLVLKLLVCIKQYISVYKSSPVLKVKV